MGIKSPPDVIISALIAWHPPSVPPESHIESKGREKEEWERQIEGGREATSLMVTARVTNYKAIRVECERQTRTQPTGISSRGGERTGGRHAAPQQRLFGELVIMSFSYRRSRRCRFSSDHHQHHDVVVGASATTSPTRYLLLLFLSFPFAE